MTTIINLTDKTVKIMRNDGTGAILPPCGVVAYIPASYKRLTTKDGIEYLTAGYGTVQGIPAPDEGIVYFVEYEVWERVMLKRSDVVTYGEKIFDKHGNYLYCRGVTYNGKV